MDAGIDPGDAVENGLGKGMETISKLFDEAKIFLPQVLAASKAMEKALEVFEPGNGKGIYKLTWYRSFSYSAR